MDTTVAPIVGGALLAVLLLLTVLRLRRSRSGIGQPDPEGMDLSGDISVSDWPVVVDEHGGDDLPTEDEAPGEVEVADDGDEAEDPVIVLEGVAVSPTAGAPTEPPLAVRSLRAQVRTLEEALQQLQDEEALEGTVSDESAFRRQVGAALRGLGERNRGDESPERMLARVTAAIERLEAPAEMIRPVLPTVAFSLSGQQVVLPSSRQDPFLPEALAIAIAPTPARITPHPSSVGPADPGITSATPPEPIPETASQSADVTDPPDPGEHVPEEWLSAPPEPEVVLPVPPQPAAPDHGHSRWGRRATASKAMR